MKLISSKTRKNRYKNNSKTRKHKQTPNYYLKNNILFSRKIPFSFNENTAPGKYLNEFLGYNNVKPLKFYNDFNKHMQDHFNIKNNKEWNIIKNSGKSCNNTLYWQVIIIPSDKNFLLHSHPNIEYIYIAEGDLYEVRAKPEKIKNGICVKKTNNEVLKNFDKKDFEYNKFTEGKFLINDPGSIHLSYTKKSRCVLFTLWSGNHLPINDYSIPYIK